MKAPLLARAIAVVSSVALVLGGSLVGASAASAEDVVAAAPVVTVTPNSAVDTTVSNTFTISGSGFTGAGAANGAYVNLGATSAWTPGTVPDASKFVKSGWVMPSSVVNGAFTTTLVIDANTLDPATSYSVSTFAAHGLSITDRSLDTLTAITLKPVVPPADPKVTITPSADVDPAVENTFTISGTGFTGAGAANGTYVNLGATSAWTPGTVPDASKFVKSGWVMPRSIVNGAFTTTLVIPANTLDRSVSYGVSTFAAHALSATDRTLDTFTPFTFKALVTPKVTVTPNANVDPTVENTFTISGTGFLGAGAANGTYVNIGSTSAWTPGTVPDASKFVKSGWVMPRSIVNGAFTTTLVIPANTLDRSVSYGVSTFAAHALSATDRTLDTLTAFTFKALVTPKVTVTPNANVDPAVENTFTIAGTGFTGAGAANGTYVNIGSTDAWTPGTVPDASKFVKSGWVMPRSIVNGAFTTTLVIPANTLDRSLSYGVSTFAAHGLSITDRSLDTFTPFTFAPVIVPTTTTTLTATPSAITVGDSTILSAQVAPVTAGSYTFALGSTILGTVAASASGAATFTVQNLPVGTQQLTATFAPATSAYAASAGTVLVLVNPVAPPVVGPPAVGAGSLTWGVKQSFREYVAGPIARGAITTSGVSTSGGAFVFSQASGGTYDRATGIGTSAYSGSVHFTGHSGLLDVTISNPIVRIDSATSGTLLVTVGGSQIPFATLNLAAASLSTPNGTVAYSGVPAALTSQGVTVFSLNGSGFYPVGTALDPVSFVIGAVGSAATPAAATVASFTATTKTPAATVPATTGVTIAPGASLTEGDEVTITASGFQPNEKGILVVVYSTPVVLTNNAAADATGTASWTGRLPEGLTGAHTLTFQGSVDRGVEITIAAKAATTALVGCVVDDATLTWGFKESFRSYISGTIANGEWTVADGATYATPNFGFTGTGSYDSETSAGSLAFPGSITFTGHGGILNTTVSNSQLRIVDETSAVLVLDIAGTTQDGAAIDRKAVEFGAVDLTGAITDDSGQISITDAPAALTAAGADAFGTYPEGEALDPITASFSIAADCALPAEAADDAVTTTTADEPTEVTPANDGTDLGWILWAVLALVLLAAIVVVVLVLRRRAAAPRA